VANRKGWDALSDAQRRRYQRAGITRQAYDSGASLAKARGHGGEAKEAAVKRIRRMWRDYGLPSPALPAFVDFYGPDDALLISEQKLAAAGHDREAVQFMRALWNTRPDAAPKQWYWYHGSK